jgi:hypothetical protein
MFSRLFENVQARIFRLFCFIAGIDHAAVVNCPRTDRIWAGHLGFSLSLSFTVIFGITYYSSGYVVIEPTSRIIVSAVVALTIFMFDRAFFQSDWFLQTSAENYQKTVWHIFRVAVRLTISIGIAFVLSTFLELAIFSDSITEKITIDHFAINKPIYDRINKEKRDLDSEIESQRKSLANLEALYQRELTDDAPLDVAAQTQFDDYEQQKKNLEKVEQGLRAQTQMLRDKIIEYQEEMNAEELGRSIKPSSSGKVGMGPQFLFAKKQKELYEARLSEIQNQILAIPVKREEFAKAQKALSQDALARRNDDRNSSQDKRNELRRRIDGGRTELSALEIARARKLDEFQRAAFASPDFQQKKDDPLSRMTAFAELKRDPKHGNTVSLFALMTLLFVVFLEVVPVLAKAFFSPLTAYGQVVRAQVELRKTQESHHVEMQDKAARKIEAEQDLEIAIRETAATGLKDSSDAAAA